MKQHRLILLAILVVCSVRGFAQAPKTVESAKPAGAADIAKPVRSVTVTPAVLEIHAAAQKRTEEARKAVEESVVWQKFVTMQSQEQTALMYALAESGLKPSDNCKPVMSKDGKLERFDCPEKTAK